MTEGHFSDTREQLAGYYIVEAKVLDEAMEIADRMDESNRVCIPALTEPWACVEK